MGLASKMKAADDARLAPAGGAGAPPQFQDPFQFHQQQFQQAPSGVPQYQAPVGPPPDQQYQAPAGAPPGQFQQYQQPPQQYQQPQHFQQQQYQQPPAPQPQADARLIELTLNRAITEKKLAAFYPNPASVAAVKDRIIATRAIERLAASWGIPIEVATGFARLALYDTVVLADDSGSMRIDDRIDDLKVILGKIATACALFDDDGIALRDLNTGVQANGVKDAQGAEAFVAKLEYKYKTKLGTVLDAKILQPFVLRPAQNGNLHKPVLVIVITDGAPEGEPKDKLEDVIKYANKVLERTKYKGNAVAYQFAQVGNDKQAQDFLSALDSNSKIGNLVDQTMSYEYEQDEMMKKTKQNLTPEMWLRKLILGAIDPSLDSRDEGDKPKAKGLFGKLFK